MTEDFDNHRRIIDACPERVEGAAMIFKALPQLGQCSTSISKTRLSSRLGSSWDQPAPIESQRTALNLQRWSARRRPPMADCLLIRVGKLYHVSVIEGPPQEGDPGRKVVARKSRRDHDRGNEHQECVQMGDSLLVDIGWINPLTDECRLVLYRLVQDGV